MLGKIPDRSSPRSTMWCTLMFIKRNSSPKKRAKLDLQQLLKLQPMIENTRQDMRQVCEKLQHQMSYIITRRGHPKTKLRTTERSNWRSPYKSTSESSSEISLNSKQFTSSSSDPDTPMSFIGESSQSYCNSQYISASGGTNNSTALLLQEISSSKTEPESQIHIVANQPSEALINENTNILYDSDETICSKEDNIGIINTEKTMVHSKSVNERMNNDICSHAFTESNHLIPNVKILGDDRSQPIFNFNNTTIIHENNNITIGINNNDELTRCHKPATNGIDGETICSQVLTENIDVNTVSKSNDDCSQPIFDFDDTTMIHENNNITIGINNDELTHYRNGIDGETICSQMLTENIDVNTVHESNGRHVKTFNGQLMFCVDNPTLNQRKNIKVNTISGAGLVSSDAAIVFETCVKTPFHKNVTVKSTRKLDEVAGTSKNNSLRTGQIDTKNTNISVKEIHNLGHNILAMNLNETSSNKMDWNQINGNEAEKSSVDVRTAQNEQVVTLGKSQYHAIENTIAPGDTKTAQEEHKTKSSIWENSNIIEDSQVFVAPTTSAVVKKKYDKGKSITKQRIINEVEVANKKQKLRDFNDLNRNVIAQQSTFEMYKWLQNISHVRQIGSGEYFSNTIVSSDFWDNPNAELPNEFLQNIHDWDDIV